ncbi:MAG: hypothetical protein ABIR24_10085 [Verrucomicrobiota bacterium]
MKKSLRSAKQGKLPHKLPDEEWKFDWVTDELARGVFLYEYFRTSDKLRNLVVSCRVGSSQSFPTGEQSREIIAAHKAGRDASKIISKTTKMFVLSHDEERLISEQTNSGAYYYSLVQSLMNCSGFPNSPAVRISRDGYPGVLDKNAGNRWLQDLVSSNGLGLCWREMNDPHQDPLAAAAQRCFKPGIEYRFNGSFAAKDYESVFPFVIDWRKTDEQIETDFHDMLRNHRPTQFKAMAVGPAKQSAFFHEPEKLPFRPRSALEWLGVFRRREGVQKWSEFWHLYGSEPFYRGCDTARKADNKKVKNILHWLETGMHLNQHDFK